ncbi:hypothetical protein [Candidatus Vidania fulgoroideorum]
MYCFLNDLLDSLSNIKDFEGFCISSFDYFGNYNFGIKDHTIFPIFFSKKKFIEPKGMNITIVIKSKSIDDSYFLLKKFKFPFL